LLRQLGTGLIQMRAQYGEALAQLGLAQGIEGVWLGARVRRVPAEPAASDQYEGSRVRQPARDCATNALHATCLELALPHADAAAEPAEPALLDAHSMM
jgi:hypothetical protein